jgi:hypothetical protein
MLAGQGIRVHHFLRYAVLGVFGLCRSMVLRLEAQLPFSALHELSQSPSSVGDYFVKTFKLYALTLLFFVAYASPASAFDWFIPVAHVTSVQASYLPLSIAFTVDTGTAACPNTTTVFWYRGDIAASQGSDPKVNVLATFSMLMKARTSGLSIWMYGLNAGCTVQFIGVN